jgi:hypothetical protein
MVIATSGEGANINYSRIVSLTNPKSYNLVALESKTFLDQTRNSYKQLKGLFIISKDNLVALIYDDNTKYTEVATINFEFPSVIYKLSMPSIENMQTGVFVDASLYYTASYS